MCRRRHVPIGDLAGAGQRQPQDEDDFEEQELGTTDRPIGTASVTEPSARNTEINPLLSLSRQPLPPLQPTLHQTQNPQAGPLQHRQPAQPNSVPQNRPWPPSPQPLNPAQNEGSPFTAVLWDTTAFPPLEPTLSHLGDRPVWASLPPALHGSDFIQVPVPATGIIIGSNVATTRVPNSQNHPSGKGGLRKQLGYSPPRKRASLTPGRRIAKKLRRGRVGRRSRFMCPRCRKMRNPDKYECTPLDHSNPRGGCVECFQTQHPCDWRGLRSEEKERERALMEQRARLTQGLKPVGTVAQWIPAVHSNAEVQAKQHELIAVAQAAANPILDPSGGSLVTSARFPTSHIQSQVQQSQAPLPQQPVRAPTQVPEEAEHGEALGQFNSRPDEALSEIPFFDPSILWDLMDVLGPEFFVFPSPLQPAIEAEEENNIYNEGETQGEEETDGT